MIKRTHLRRVFSPIKCIKCKDIIKLGDDYYSHRSGNEHCEKCYNYRMSKTVSEMFNLEKTFNEAVDPFKDDKPAVSSKLTIHKASDEVGCAACSA